MQERVRENVEPWPSADLREEADLAPVSHEPWGPVAAPPQTILTEGACVAGSQAQHEAPAVTRVVGDAAGQAQEIPAAVARCWGPEGRHDQQVRPVSAPHPQLRAACLEQDGDDDREVRKDTARPTPADAARPVRHALMRCWGPRPATRRGTHGSRRLTSSTRACWRCGVTRQCPGTRTPRSAGRE